MQTPEELIVCNKCSSDSNVKNGFMNGKQRYLCHGCGSNFTLNDRRRISADKKKLAIHMYLEGLGFSSIARVLEISDVIVLKWVEKIASIVEEVRKQDKISKKAAIRVMELDEMWHYIGKKNESAGSGWLWIGTPEGSLPGSLALVAKKQARSSGKK